MISQRLSVVFNTINAEKTIGDSTLLLRNLTSICVTRIIFDCQLAKVTMMD